MKRKALGKGLSSLIPDKPPPGAIKARQQEAETTPETGLLQIDLDQIRPNKGQPREQFDPVQLEELAQSVQAQGVLQPVIVRLNPEGGYDLVAGERRWRAAQIAGLMKIPAVVKEVADDRMLEIALIENLQREELNPIEEANAYQSLIDDLRLTQQEIADRVGKQRATIANALRLLNLPAEVQGLIKTAQISAGHAKALAALTVASEQIELARQIAKLGLSVRQAEALAGRIVRRSSRSLPKKQPVRDPNVVAAEETLQSAIGTRVRIVQGKKGGRLEIHFFSDEELERVYQLVLNAARKT
jgi:ParB family chromosome partitioning protein